MTYKHVSQEAEKRVSCKYELTTLVSKRARQLVDFKECNDEFKPVLQALDEFEEENLKKAE